MSAELFIENLSKDTDCDELGMLFSEAGFVESCLVMTDSRSGRSKGQAFLQMKTKEDAAIAKVKFNGHALRGQPLRVTDAGPGGERRNTFVHGGKGRA